MVIFLFFSFCLFGIRGFSQKKYITVLPRLTSNHEDKQCTCPKRTESMNLSMCLLPSSDTNFHI